MMKVCHNDGRPFVVMWCGKADKTNISLYLSPWECLSQSAVLSHCLSLAFSLYLYTLPPSFLSLPPSGMAGVEGDRYVGWLLC